MLVDPKLLERAQRERISLQTAQYRTAMESVIPADEALGIKQVLQSPVGVALLSMLKRLHVDGDLVGANDAETYFRLGQRDVVQTLRRLSGEFKDERTGTGS